MDRRGQGTNDFFGVFSDGWRTLIAMGMFVPEKSVNHRFTKQGGTADNIIIRP